MPEMDDIELLAQYTQRNSEEAFATLVARHVNLVYSVAMRHVGNAHQAEEITQAVFIILARKARGLSKRTVLSGWLYQTARLTAANFLRAEIRRTHREQEAYMQSLSNETEPDSWPQIAPLLDTAMAGLSDKDRNAIVLRFFDGKTLKDVGVALGASEDAAKMRVNRAVEKLRKFFTKRGLTLSAAAIAGTVSANAVQAAPVGLATTISAAALAGTTAVTAVTIAATKAIAMITLQKTLITATIVAAIGTGIYEARQASTLRTKVQTLQQQQAEQIQQLQNERDDATSQLSALRDDNKRLKRNAAELLKLRGEVGQLRRQLDTANRETSQPVAPAQNAQKLTNHLPGTYIPLNEVGFAGYATPEAALETITWKLWNATYDQMVEELPLSADEKAKELNNTKSREDFNTQRKKYVSHIKGLQIIAKKVLTEDKVELKVLMAHDDSPDLPPERTPYAVQSMIKVGNEWRLGGSTYEYQNGWENKGQIQMFAK